MKIGHILVVDDNPANLKLIRAVMKRSQHFLTCATDAEKAREVIDSLEKCDLILMDIGLPGMDGLTFTRLLKADPKTRDIPIIALTAYAMKGDEEKALAAGCDAYISKPINTRTFVSLVEAYLPK